MGPSRLHTHPMTYTGTGGKAGWARGRYIAAAILVSALIPSRAYNLVSRLFGEGRAARLIDAHSSTSRAVGCLLILRQHLRPWCFRSALHIPPLGPTGQGDTRQGRSLGVTTYTSTYSYHGCVPWTIHCIYCPSVEGRSGSSHFIGLPQITPATRLFPSSGVWEGSSVVAS